MGRVVEKATMRVYDRANTPKYDPADFVINPENLQALLDANTPSKYWKVSVDELDVEDIVEMTQAEKDAVDVADFPTIQLTKLGQMSGEVTTFIYARYDEATQSSLGKFLTTAGNAGLTNRVAHISAAIDWVENLLTYFYTRKAAILATTTQEELDAESWDFSFYDAFASPDTNADPQVTIESALAIHD
jgi:hypothetical protein